MQPQPSSNLSRCRLFALASAAFTLAILTLSACQGSLPAAAPPQQADETDLSGIRQYLVDHTQALKSSTATLKQISDRYYALAAGAEFDYARLWREQKPAVVETLNAARDSWKEASPRYEQMEGIVAGVPALASFDVIIDAGASGEDDPVNAAPIDLNLPDGRTLAEPGNLFGVTESTLWGAFPAYAVPVIADWDGDGTISFGETLPDANVLKAGVDALDEQAGRLAQAAGAWQPTLADAFTALVVMTPTMSEYFASWRDSRFVSGNASTQRDFVAISRLADMQNILDGLQLVYAQVQPVAAAVDADQAAQVAAGLADLHAFVANVYAQEQGGKRFAPEEADLLGAEAQNRATAITGHISQLVAQLSAPMAPVPNGNLAAVGESLRSHLLETQLQLSGDAAEAQAALAAAQQEYEQSFAGPFAQDAPTAAQRISAGFSVAARSLVTRKPAALASARATIWTGVLDGAYGSLLAALNRGDAAAAQRWLQVREFSQASRFVRPTADATLAIRQLAAGQADAGYARQAVYADLLDAYQERLAAALQDVADADTRAFTTRRAEAAAQAQGYFAILAPAYVEQHGAAAAEDVAGQLSQLVGEAVSAKPTSSAAIAGTLQSLDTALADFRAAPLSPADQARRAAQLLRFLALVPVEYARGVNGSQVTNDLELSEAIAFGEAAQNAFADLQPDLAALDAAGTGQVDDALDRLQAMLAEATARTSVAAPGEVQAAADKLGSSLHMLLPAAWQQHNSAADFDLIAASLGHMQTAAAAGDYARAEAARLEAYALLESGPEARLFAFAPQYIAPIEGLFWYGQGENAGLAALLQKKVSVAEIAAARQQLDSELSAAQAALGGQASPTAMALNAAILVFREGLEAVVILAALTASMVGARRMYRRPMALGVALAFVASALTWWLLQTVLFAFRGYGERLEAVVSLVAIGVLLLITNWFFHRVYWTDWMAELHSRKKTLLGGAVAGQILGFLTLGFTSVYREGFETVLFLQALVLDAGFWPIFQGTIIGLLGVFTAGWLTFKLQSRLPYKRMLVGTGILIGVVLLVMVGNTVHVMQIVGWLPVHPIRWLALPYWVGLWFGTYATWEGILLQGAAGAFVIGSYITAEALTKRGTRRPAERAVGSLKQDTLVKTKLEHGRGG